MKIVSEKECAKIIDKHITNFSNVSKMPLWNYWKRIQPIICLIYAFVSFVLATETMNYYKFDIISLFNIPNFNFCWKSFIAIICFVIIITTMVIMVIIHELVHVLCYKIFKYKCIIVVNKSLTISVLHLNWAKKLHELCAIILPFFITLIITCVLQFILNNSFFFLWMIIINLAISCSDIFSFIFILKTTPNDAMIFGHYFRRQQ